MKNIKKTIMSVAVVVILLLSPMLVIADNERPPDAPIIEGPIRCIVGRMYTYTVTVNDPDGDDMHLIIYWNGEAEYVGQYQSRESVNVRHTWAQIGRSHVRAIAIDLDGNMGEFSEYYYLDVDVNPNPDLPNSPPYPPSKVEGPETLEIGEVGTYTTIAYDANYDDLRYVFAWGDGLGSMEGPLSPGQDAVSSHSWEEAGTYSIEVMASDPFACQSSWSDAFDVEVLEPEPEPNNPPNTPFGVEGATTCTVGETYTYNTSTTDPDGDDVYYVFYWGYYDTFPHSEVDVVGPYASGEAVSIEHTWSRIGVYGVSVKALDIHHGMSELSPEILVCVTPVEGENNPPNMPTMSGEILCEVGGTYTYEVVATDPDEGDELYYKIYWGNYEYDTDLLGPYSSGEVASIEHTWETVGRYGVSVTVTDQDGAYTHLTGGLDVVVSDSEPEPNTSPTVPVQVYGVSTCTVGDTWAYRTISYDADGDDILYTFYWGDGSSDTLTRTQAQPAILTHTWGYSGVYSVRVTACDGVNPPTGYSPGLTVHVLPVEEDDNNAPNRPYLAGEINCLTGQPYIYSTVAIDPDGDDIIYTFEWSDETSTTEGPFTSGDWVLVEHTWENEGTYPITVVAKDVNDHYSQPSRELLVTVTEPEQENQPPEVPVISGPTENVPLGEDVRYELSSTDPEGDDIYFEYYTYNGGNLISEGICSSQSGTAFLLISWKISGLNRIVVHAVDEHGLRSSGQVLDVNVEGPDSVAPSKPIIWCATGHNALIQKNIEFSFDSSDPDGDNIYYYIEWGDGRYQETNWVIYGDEKLSVYHRYTGTGSYHVRAKAIDSNGMESEWSDGWHMSISNEKGRFYDQFPIFQLVYEIINRLMNLR